MPNSMARTVDRQEAWPRLRPCEHVRSRGGHNEWHYPLTWRMDWAKALFNCPKQMPELLMHRNFATVPNGSKFVRCPVRQGLEMSKSLIDSFPVRIQTARRAAPTEFQLVLRAISTSFVAIIRGGARLLSSGAWQSAGRRSRGYAPLSARLEIRFRFPSGLEELHSPHSILLSPKRDIVSKTSLPASIASDASPLDHKRRADPMEDSIFSLRFSTDSDESHIFIHSATIP